MLDNKDIFYLNKNEILDILSKIDDVIFVGGTSEYLQGVKKELNDIDIRITNFENLTSIGYIHKFNLDLFYGLSGNRGIIKLKNFLIDIFIENDKPNFIIIDNKYKCETIESMINLREKTLKFSNFCDNRVLNKIKYNLIRLKKWTQLPQ